MSALDPLTLPLFPFRCSGCDKDFFKTLVDLVMDNTVSCTFCGVHLVVSDYYRKPELEEFLIRHGYKGFHLGTVK